MRRAVFLDRDGVISRPILRDNKPYSPREPDEFHIMENVAMCLRRSKEAGFLNIVVTNQPDLSRGLMVWNSLDTMHSRIKAGLDVDDIMVCPHDDSDKCSCRKPKPGMLLDAARKWNVDLRQSFMIGDQWKDVKAGREAGCYTILIDYPYNQEVDADCRTKDLQSAIDIVLGNGDR